MAATHKLPSIALQCPPSKPNQSFCSSSSLISSLSRRKLTFYSFGPIGHQCKISGTVTGMTASTAMLPTLKHKDPAVKIPSWSARALKTFALAGAETVFLCYPKMGTEALLLGILIEGTSLAAKLLRAKGMTIAKVRQDVVDLLGKSHFFYLTPECPPLTKQANWALDWAVDEKLKSGREGEITLNHLLLGIWAQEQSAGHKVMAGYGFDDQIAKELAEKIDRDSDFCLKDGKESLLSLKRLD